MPLHAGEAFAAGRTRVLAYGQSVLQAKNGRIFEVHPDGREVFVRATAPRTHVAAGTVFMIP